MLFSVGETIESTITWRKSFGIHTIDPKEIRALAKSGLAYVSHKTDKHGRTLVYIHISRNIQAQPELLLKFLMYTVERADRASVRAGSGQFLALIDLADFSWGNCPSMSMMKSALDLLKYHYPHRLAGTYIVNTGGVFQFVWNVLKPLIPKKVLIKTFVLNGEEMKKVLDTNLGLDTLATEFGGAVNHTHFKDDKNLDSYFAAGFWPKKK